MKWLEKHSLIISHILCVMVILITAWPSLQRPRLEADDYRYLHHIQQWSAGNMDAVECMIVENRWDHLWFMQEDGVIRFFRPTVILSYALDLALWGDVYPLGLVLTNVLIHLGCSLLVVFLLHRLLGAGLHVVFSSMLFAGLASHSECIWYVAGRTDSLAAFGFLAAFSLHLSGRSWWALLFFAFGFLTKEMVVVAPVILLAYDVWVERRKVERKLFAFYTLIGGAVLLLKHLALGGVGSDFVYPYLVSPFEPGFGSHLWLQVQSYGGNLLAAEVTVPFADAETVDLLHNQVILWVGIVLFLIGAWLLRRDRRLLLFMLLGASTWLPTSFVYLSERYLYLPSVAFVGIIGLLVCQIVSTRWQLLLCGLLGLFAVFHSVKLHERHAVLAQKPGAVQEVLKQLEPVGHKIEKGDSLLLVNFPGYFVRAQFAQEIFRIVYDDLLLNVDVLTMMPGQDGTEWESGDAYPVMGAGVQLHKLGSNRINLSGRRLAAGQPRHVIKEAGPKAFNWVSLSSGIYSTADFRVKVIEGSGSGATILEVEKNTPFTGCKVLIWRADCKNLGEHPWDRRQKAKVDLIRL